MRKKYADESTGARHFGDGNEDMSDEITQQTLLPGIKLVLVHVTHFIPNIFKNTSSHCIVTIYSIRDPSLWMVKCRMGEEKSTVLLLMRKCIAYSTTPEPLQIRTVIAPEGIKGYIYIEAFKQTHVKQVRN